MRQGHNNSDTGEYIPTEQELAAWADEADLANDELDNILTIARELRDVIETTQRCFPKADVSIFRDHFNDAFADVFAGIWDKQVERLHGEYCNKTFPRFSPDAPKRIIQNPSTLTAIGEKI